MRMRPQAVVNLPSAAMDLWTVLKALEQRVERLEEKVARQDGMMGDGPGTREKPVIIEG